MSQQILHEEHVPFSRAGDEFPIRPHISTLHRWRLRGVRGVKLESLLVGGRRFTSREAVHRFLQAINGAGEIAHSEKKNAKLDGLERDLRRDGI